ncbi:peptide deformylase [Roseobacter sp.]|uniref:peptide deformylase n=1 Tax=Roseobacter sp. TaxID=1907202 RepID=UPI0025D8D9CA|nr:peptide deformylase [Roseobacter sp.]
MSILPIVQWPDPRLAQVCADIPAVTPDIARLAADMLETMYAAPGRGLAAPQVGVMQRIFVIDARWKDAEPAPVVFINPVLISVSEDEVTQDEGCLSIRGVLAGVTRPARVRMGWTDLQGAQQHAWFEGFEAACVQHELDHLNGVVTLDHLSEPVRDNLLRLRDAALT